ncbi:MAG: hypothetical protein U1E14_12590 [Geminicoccaceae bacterium]
MVSPGEPFDGFDGNGSDSPPPSDWHVDARNVTVGGPDHLSRIIEYNPIKGSYSTVDASFFEVLGLVLADFKHPSLLLWAPRPEDLSTGERKLGKLSHDGVTRTPSRRRGHSGPFRCGENVMDGIVRIIVELIAGAIGGNISGAAAKGTSIGTAGNSVAGAIGGVILSQVLGALMGGGGTEAVADAAAAATGGGFDLGALVGQVAGGGIGGIILQLIVGFIMNRNKG